MLYMIVCVCSFLLYDFILCQKWRNKTVQSKSFMCWVISEYMHVDKLPAKSRGRHLVSFRFENRLPVHSTEIYNNKHVCRQSKVRKPTGSRVEWAECWLNLGSSSSFSLIIDRSVGLSVGIHSAGDSVPETLVRILRSVEEGNLSPFDFKITCLCQSIKIK